MTWRDRIIGNWLAGQRVAAQAPPPADIPAAAAYKAPVFPPPAPERYFRCRPCDVEWRGTDPACWCCGRNVLAS